MKPHPLTTLRLLGCALALIAAGCANTAREQDGDIDIEVLLGAYITTVTPTSATVTQSSGTAIIPFGVSGQCTGIFDPLKCTAIEPYWGALGFGDGIEVVFDNQRSNPSDGRIEVDVAKAYKRLKLPNGIQGGSGSIPGFIQSRGFLEGLQRGPHVLITLTIQHPGSPPARPEISPDLPALAAPGKLTLKPASGATTITLPCPITYTGPATRLLPGTFSGPDAAHFSGGVISRDIGGDHGNNDDGFVTFTLPPAPGPFAYSATLTISTENGASMTVALKGLRP